MLCDILDELLLSIFRVKLGQEVKGDRFLLRYLLIQNLQQWIKEISISISFSCLLQILDINNVYMAYGCWQDQYNIRITYPLFHLQPSNCVLDIVLEPKEPCLPQSQSSAYQVKKVFSFPPDLKHVHVLVLYNFLKVKNRKSWITRICRIHTERGVILQHTKQLKTLWRFSVLELNFEIWK